MEVALLVAEPNVSRSAVDQHYFILDHTSSDPAQRIGRKWQLQLAAYSALHRCGSCMLKTSRGGESPMVLKAPTESEQPGDIARYFDRQGLYQTEFDGRVPVYIRLAVRTEYGELRSLVLPLLSWVPAERVEVLS